MALAAIDAVERRDRPLVYLSPRGLPLTQKRVGELAGGSGAILLCGRFEGLDQRAIDARVIEEISLGDFVLAGGEIAAMALIEAVVRLIPGVLGDAQSPAEGELLGRPARISAIYQAADGRGPGHPGGPKQRKSQGNRQVAHGPGRGIDAGATPRPLGPL
ncbi:MAG: hypothetical protein WDM81_11035 [Rhizomicrobium sp.]